MKKIVTILLILALSLGLATMSAFAVQMPSENADAFEWERYADQIEGLQSYEEVAAAYKKAAEKYCEHVEEGEAYFSAAYSCYNKAIELFKTEGMYDEVLECYEAVGDAALRCERYQEAREAYAKAIDITEELDIEDKYLSSLYEKMADSLVALESYRDAAAEYYHAMNKADSSEESYADLCLKYAQALEACGSPDNPDEEENIARAFADASGEFLIRGNAEDAIAIMRRAANHYEKAGRTETAQNSFALLVVDLAQAGKGDIAASLCFEIYDTYGPGKYTAALFTNYALPYYESIADYESAALACDKAGDCYKETGDNQLAKQCYEDAADYYKKAGNSSKAEAMKEKINKNFALGSILSEGGISIIFLILVIIIIAFIVVKKKKAKQ